MAKKKTASTYAFPKSVEELKNGLDIKIKIDKTESGRITITVTLLNDGEVVASDYDFVNV